MIEDGIWLTSLWRVAGVARLTDMNLEKDETIRNDLYQWKDWMDSVENEAICESVHVCMCVLRIEDREEKTELWKISWWAIIGDEVLLKNWRWKKTRMTVEKFIKYLQIDKKTKVNKK